MLQSPKLKGRTNMHTKEPWIVQKLNHAESDPWYQIGWLENGYGVGPICELSGGAVRSKAPVWHPVAEFKYLHAEENEIKANATHIVSCVNALAGRNPDAIKGLVEAAEFAYDACFDGSPIDNESVKQRLERALKNLKGE